MLNNSIFVNKLKIYIIQRTEIEIGKLSDYNTRLDILGIRAMYHSIQMNLRKLSLIKWYEPTNYMNKSMKRYRILWLIW